LVKAKGQRRLPLLKLRQHQRLSQYQKLRRLLRLWHHRHHRQGRKICHQRRAAWSKNMVWRPR
jgi:hypothetical protein